MECARCRTHRLTKIRGQRVSRLGDLNAFLLVLAIGLATLDLTCFWAFKMRDALPAMALATTSSAAANPSKAPQPKQAEASRPNAPKVGWQP
jgi:hypothetical protein